MKNRDKYIYINTLPYVCHVAHSKTVPGEQVDGNGKGNISDTPPDPWGKPPRLQIASGNPRAEIPILQTPSQNIQIDLSDLDKLHLQLQIVAREMKIGRFCTEIGGR